MSDNLLAKLVKEPQKLGLQQPSAPMPGKLSRGADFGRWEARVTDSLLGLMLRREAKPSWACWTAKSTTSHGPRLLGRRAFLTVDAAALNQWVLEQFIAGVRDPEIRKALMRDQPATLGKALDLARQEEALQAVCDRPAQPLLGNAAVRPQTVRDCGTQTPRRPCSCGSYYLRQNQWRRQPPCRGPGPQTRRPVQAIDVSTEEHGVLDLVRRPVFSLIEGVVKNFKSRLLVRAFCQISRSSSKRRQPWP
ncbi:hypothetical protein SprV_0702357900 [Sparganum proliferum]